MVLTLLFPSFLQFLLSMCLPVFSIKHSTCFYDAHSSINIPGICICFLSNEVKIPLVPMPHTYHPSVVDRMTSCFFLWQVLHPRGTIPLPSPSPSGLLSVAFFVFFIKISYSKKKKMELTAILLLHWFWCSLPCASTSPAFFLPRRRDLQMWKIAKLFFQDLLLSIATLM